MSDSTTTTQPGPATAEGERRLVRPADDRVIAGVCTALSRYFGISPIIYRVAFAALILLGGSGLVLYAAAWLVIPDERRGDSIVAEAIRERRRRPWLAIGVGLLALGLAFGIVDLWPRADDFWLLALAVGLAVVWWQQNEPRKATPVAPAETHDQASDRHELRPQPGEQLRHPSPRRFPIFLPVIGVLVVGAGLLGILQEADVVSVDWTLALAGGVLLVGLAVAVGAFFGGVGALAAMGAVLAAIMLAVSTIDVPLQGPIGDRSERPFSVADLDKEYRQSIGRMNLDLTAFTLPEGRTEITASVGVGELVIRLPDGARLEVDAKVSAGEALVFGVRRSGVDVERTVVETQAGADARTLIVRAEVGLGDLEVLRG
jgi:phage shock protein PspC (stress-responsive transcriptional regulator)